MTPLQRAAVAAGVVLRPVRESDEAFLFRLYASTRAEELAHTGWDAAARHAFLRFQFDAQRAHYTRAYPSAEYVVVEREHAPIGRLYVDRTPTEILVIDIAILPEHRGAGLGSTLLRGLLDEADATGRVTTLHVEHDNPARRLYGRLGFVPTAEQGPYVLMQRPPGPRQ